MARQRARFNISAPIVCRWRDRRGSYAKADGVTRDIGIGGLFIVTNGPFPPENVNIRCEAALPSIEKDCTKWRLRILGIVQRARFESEGNETAGFAVRTRRLLLGNDVRRLNVTVN